MNKGWVKLHRSIMESAVWSDPLRLKAWIYLLLTVNYEDKEWFHRGQLIKLKRGQRIASIKSLSQAWGCSEKTVRKILEQFTELGMIKTETVIGKYTGITVIKYKVFQDQGQGEVTGEDITEYRGEDRAEYIAEDIAEGSSDYLAEDTLLRSNKNNIKKDIKNNQEIQEAEPRIGFGGRIIEE